ncbi:hypothetical protein EON81_20925 [bacterium]|nr:MAG: hypothetical protein EON81_20925 [bacterium]
MAAELAILKTVVELIASDTVVRGVKTVWQKMPWAKDRAKVDEVERRISRLVDEAAQLARNLSPEAVAPEMDRLLDRFAKDLVAEGIPAEQAKELRDSVRAQLRTSVLQPMEDVRRVQSRLEALEKDNGDLARRVVDLESRREEGKTDIHRLHNMLMISIVLGTAGLVLALAAVLLRR